MHPSIRPSVRQSAHPSIHSLSFCAVFTLRLISVSCLLIQQSLSIYTCVSLTTHDSSISFIPSYPLAYLAVSLPSNNYSSFSKLTLTSRLLLSFLPSCLPSYVFPPTSISISARLSLVPSICSTHISTHFLQTYTRRLHIKQFQTLILSHIIFKAADGPTD